MACFSGDDMAVRWSHDTWKSGDSCKPSSCFVPSQPTPFRFILKFSSHTSSMSETTRSKLFLSMKEKTIMKNSRGKDIRSRRRTALLPSGFAAAGVNFTDQEDRPTLAMQGNSETEITESKSKTQWTDEKHSLYLKSIEASFVNQLNNSEQFKVFRGGRWQRVNFERSLNPAFSRMNECHDFVANPWIQRFRSASNHQNTASTSQQIESVENSASSCSLNTSSKQQYCHSPMCDEFTLCNNAEVSDQNFVDEDDGHGEIESWNRKIKIRGNTEKMRTSMPDIESKDQIVPLR